MGKCLPERLDRTFHALADATRRAMVERLVLGPASVSQLAEPFDFALPTIVKHLRVLEDAGIIASHKAGRVRTYQLAVDAMAGATEWIARQRMPHERALDRLGGLLAENDAE
ncbi:ArsR/SmtB family transcription factor [Cumulibacter soli]|uniref:ArsR/SmtB family transcription factor n=1 Tax=Cumulibacter soli TaxID=2546344 RepID=UPI001067D6E9|nr:metalloregulator ArsR/SmtB family transcription factor [Cumulibacter soli]